MKYIEDKTQNYRGNHDKQMAWFDTTNAWFISQAQCTYSTFRGLCKRLGEKFGANSCTIDKVDYSKTLVVVCELSSGFKFWIEPDDWKTTDDRIYLTEEQLRA